MQKKTVRRCIRPQCMAIYEETDKSRFCMCGALLQITEIEIKPKKNSYKKPINPSKPKSDFATKPEENPFRSSETGNVVKVDINNNTNDVTETVDDANEQVRVVDSEENGAANEDAFDFFENDEDDEQTEDSENNIPSKKAYLYLLLEDEDVEFELSSVTRIGRSTDGGQVDIDLSEYAGKDVSREHAVIRREKDGYYIMNVSRNHSVRVMDQNDNEVALEYGKRILLNTGDGIILSKKILLQFEEEE